MCEGARSQKCVGARQAAIIQGPGSQLELYSKGAIKKREPANREPRIQQRW